MPSDVSTAGRYVAIWSFFTITQSFRLHFHHLQFYAGELMSKSIISCLYEYINAHTTYKPKPDPLISIILYFREKNLGNKEHSISQSI